DFGGRAGVSGILGRGGGSAGRRGETGGRLRKGRQTEKRLRLQLEGRSGRTRNRVPRQYFAGRSICGDRKRGRAAPQNFRRLPAGTARLDPGRRSGRVS